MEDLITPEEIEELIFLLNTESLEIKDIFFLIDIQEKLNNKKTYIFENTNSRNLFIEEISDKIKKNKDITRYVYNLTKDTPFLSKRFIAVFELPEENEKSHDRLKTDINAQELKPSNIPKRTSQSSKNIAVNISELNVVKLLENELCRWIKDKWSSILEKSKDEINNILIGNDEDFPKEEEDSANKMIYAKFVQFPKDIKKLEEVGNEFISYLQYLYSIFNDSNFYLNDTEIIYFLINYEQESFRKFLLRVVHCFYEKLEKTENKEAFLLNTIYIINEKYQENLLSELEKEIKIEFKEEINNENSKIKLYINKINKTNNISEKKNNLKSTKILKDFKMSCIINEYIEESESFNEMEENKKYFLHQSKIIQSTSKQNSDDNLKLNKAESNTNFKDNSLRNSFMRSSNVLEIEDTSLEMVKSKSNSVSVKDTQSKLESLATKICSFIGSDWENEKENEQKEVESISNKIKRVLDDTKNDDEINKFPKLKFYFSVISYLLKSGKDFSKIEVPYYKKLDLIAKQLKKSDPLPNIRESLRYTKKNKEVCYYYFKFLVFKVIKSYSTDTRKYNKYLQILLEKEKTNDQKEKYIHINLDILGTYNELKYLIYFIGYKNIYELFKYFILQGENKITKFQFLLKKDKEIAHKEIAHKEIAHEENAHKAIATSWYQAYFDLLISFFDYYTTCLNKNLLEEPDKKDLFSFIQEIFKFYFELSSSKYKNLERFNSMISIVIFFTGIYFKNEFENKTCLDLIKESDIIININSYNSVKKGVKELCTDFVKTLYEKYVIPDTISKLNSLFDDKEDKNKDEKLLPFKQLLFFLLMYQSPKKKIFEKENNNIVTIMNSIVDCNLDQVQSSKEALRGKIEEKEKKEKEEKEEKEEKGINNIYQAAKYFIENLSMNAIEKKKNIIDYLHEFGNIVYILDQIIVVGPLTKNCKNEPKGEKIKRSNTMNNITAPQKLIPERKKSQVDSNKKIIKYFVKLRKFGEMELFFYRNYSKYKMVNFTLSGVVLNNKAYFRCSNLGKWIDIDGKIIDKIDNVFKEISNDSKIFGIYFPKKVSSIITPKEKEEAKAKYKNIDVIICNAKGCDHIINKKTLNNSRLKESIARFRDDYFKK